MRQRPKTTERKFRPGPFASHEKLASSHSPGPSGCLDPTRSIACAPCDPSTPYALNDSDLAVLIEFFKTLDRWDREHTAASLRTSEGMK